VKHPNTQTLLAYWHSRRHDEPAPQRADIAPEDLGSLLSNLFLLRRMDQGHHVFRLAGTGLCRMHQREFRDQNFLSLWQGHDRVHVSALLEGALSTPAPASLVTQAVSLDGEMTDVEIALLPLRGPEGWLDRVLGLYQPLTPRPANSRPIVRHRLQALHPAQCPAPHYSAFTAPSYEAVGLRVANDS
tara:strand:+ start:364 stop:924 length:561 start_codon:yes stop_codon:yes gene_type:complete